MISPFYVLTIFKDASAEKDIMNTYDLKVFQSLDEAKEQALSDEYDGMDYNIEECYEWNIIDFNESEDDDLIEDNVIYRPLADIEDWPIYDWPYKTLGEAKKVALECIKNEHCSIHIEKSKRNIVFSKEY